jgi:DNA repair exonuclease SbcCD ATPase subunit
VGKSTLAMASLWALTGSLDPRPTQDGKVADVVNDLSRVADVTLRGSINTEQFLVKRTKSITGKDSSLTFVLNGKVLTQQSIQATQELIDKHFSTRSLMRTIFQGQHSIGGLLESTDSKLKDELSSLVSLDVWQKSASLARLKQRELLRKIAEVEGMISIRGKDKLRAQEKTLLAKEEMKRRDKVHEIELQMLSQKEQSLHGDSVTSDIETAMNLVQLQLNECESEIDRLEEEASISTYSDNDEINTLRSKLKEKVRIDNNETSNLQLCQRKHEIALMELQSIDSRLSRLQSEWNVSTSEKGNSSSFSSPEKCHACGQPIVSTAAQGYVRENFLAVLSTAKRQKNKAQETVSLISKALAESKEIAGRVNLEVQLYTKQLRTAEEKRSLRSDGLLQKIKEARKMQSMLSNEFATLARKAKEVSEFDLLISRMQTQLNGSKEAFKASVIAHESCCNDLAAIESNIEELTKQKEESTDLAALNTLLADTFGPKGVQAFVLRNIVQSLQYCSQIYLDELSDGSLQLRMQVGSNDSIIKQATVRNPDGTWRVRPLSSLSGGQWRRCSLSLSLGYIDLASKRGRMRSSLLVLDEPLTHLDSAGRKSVGKLLRKMLNHDCDNGKTGIGSIGLSTILVILQEIAAEEIEDCFDQTDEIIKLGGESFVIIDENHDE